MPWKPEYPGEVPTLGYQAIQWCHDYLVIPDGVSQGKPFKMVDWQQQATLDAYVLDPATGKRVNRRLAAILAKGIGKSPWAAALALFEFVGPAVWDGWDADGRPVARPWNTPWIQVAATAEDQTKNTWDAVFGMLVWQDEHGNNRLLNAYPSIDPGRTRVFLRGQPMAKMEPVTAEAGTREGQRVTFGVLDETGLWTPSKGGVSLAATIRRNVAKMGGMTFETTNSFVPGEESVAERTHEAVKAMREGRTRRKGGIVYLHTQAPPDTDLSDYDSLIKGLRIAYMDTPWIDYDRLVDEIWDPATDPGDARRFYLNQIVSSADAWMTQQAWDVCADPAKSLVHGDTVTLGFDGSLFEDATALVACRLEDAHLQVLGIWEKPVGLGRKVEWQVDTEEVDACLRKAFKDYDVVAFFADPPFYQDFINSWTRDFGKRLKVQANMRHPIEFWTNRGTAMVAALERFHTAIVSAEVTHDGSDTLTRHVLNAKRKDTTAGLVIRKDFPGSARKIDACMAACLAYEARSECIEAGVQPRRNRIPSRIR